MNRKDRRILMKKGKIEQFAGEISRLAKRDANSAATVNSMTLSMWVLHEEFGFGGERLRRFYRAMAKQAKCINEHYVSVADIQRTLHDECGINIDGAASANE